MTASPTHATEITSSRAEPDEQPSYPLSNDASTADATGSSAATTAPAAPPATTTTQEDPAASAATPPSLLDHVSSSVDVF